MIESDSNLVLISETISGIDDIDNFCDDKPPLFHSECSFLQILQILEVGRSF